LQWRVCDGQLLPARCSRQACRCACAHPQGIGRGPREGVRKGFVPSARALHRAALSTLCVPACLSSRRATHTSLRSASYVWTWCSTIRTHPSARMKSSLECLREVSSSTRGDTCSADPAQFCAARSSTLPTQPLAARRRSRSMRRRSCAFPYSRVPPHTGHGRLRAVHKHER